MHSFCSANNRSNSAARVASISFRCLGCLLLLRGYLLSLDLEALEFFGPLCLTLSLLYLQPLLLHLEPVLLGFKGG